MLSNLLPRSLQEVRQDGRSELLKTIFITTNGLCKIFSKTIPAGVAYNHSGLTLDEIKLMEDSYSSGVLCLLCCTSTLAAGVNLPAKRIIIRSPYVGNCLISQNQYKQMAGRADRAGIETHC